MVQTKIKKEIQKLIKDQKFYAVSSNFSPEEQMSIRRFALESLTKKELKTISSPIFDIKTVSNKNCANLIGKVKIPLGIAGPLKIDGDYISGKVFVPLATTEGALVASVN